MHLLIESLHARNTKINIKIAKKNRRGTSKNNLINIFIYLFIYND